MHFWILLVVIGQFLSAIVALIDKYIVTSKSVVLRPLAYAFWLSVLSAGSVVIYLLSWIPIPIDGLDFPSFANIQAPSLMIAALALAAGYAYFTALLSFFTALKSSDASDVVPVVGGLTALATLLLSFSFLDAELTRSFFYGFVLLTLGTVVVSKFRFTPRTVLSTAHAGLMFGVHYVALKGLFNVTNFDTAFFWSRAAIVFVALSLLLVPEYSEKIISRTRESHAREGVFVIGNKILAGVASLLLLKAIEFGDVALVQALGGLQFLFLLLISAFFGPRIARDCGENVSTRDIIQKSISISLIVCGFFLLFL